MKTLQNYVEKQFADVYDSREKKEMIEEISINLQEKVSDLMREGKSEEDAINKAIVDFGDIGEIKKEIIQKQSGEKRKRAALRLGFSIWGSVLIIGLVCFIDLYFTPSILWCVFPIFAVLWWPLSMLFVWLKHR
jgi:translation initiation factor RLI1